MKEAAGEANMTVIVIVLIGLVAAAGAILIPNLLDTMGKNSACNAAGGSMVNGFCQVNGGKNLSCSKTNGNWVCSG